MWIGAALYIVFLVIAPFAHHDLECHLKTPSHCTSCAASHLGADPDPLAAQGTSALADAGRAQFLHILTDGTFLSVRSTGRSPPLHATL